MSRFVKVDLTQHECEAIHALCDLTRTMLDQVGSTISQSARESLIINLNSVRYKMGAAATLFGHKPNLIVPSMLALDLSKKSN